MKKEREWVNSAVAVLKDCLPHIKAWVPENKMEEFAQEQFLKRLETTIIEGEKMK